MISFRFYRSILITILIVLFTPPAISVPRRKGNVKSKKGPPTINLQAEQVSKAVPKYNPDTTRETAIRQMEQLIHLVAKTNRDNLSSNTSLVRTAMDFREDIGERERTLSLGAIAKAWDTAHAYGAIRNHHFHGAATAGRFSGEPLVFENIVPTEILPECQGYIGNLRLVPQSLKRKKDTPLSAQDKAFEIGLRQIMHEADSLARMREIQKSKVGHLAMSLEEHDKRWRAEVDAIDGSLTMLPSIQILAQKMGTPSKLNGYRYKLRVEVSNISRHPTEVEVESVIVGYSDNGNKLYEMRRDKRVLRMRRSQVDEYVIQTPNVNAFKKALVKFDPKKSQKVAYRGFTIMVHQNGELIESTGSDARLLKVSSGEYPSPTMIIPASRAGGTKPALEPYTSSSTDTSQKLVQFATPKDLASGKNGIVVSSAPVETVALMSDGTRMYQLDFDGILSVYESNSFESSKHELGEIFANRYVHSLFSDGTGYYIHLSQPTAKFADNAMVRFSSVEDLISGSNGTVVGEPVAGSAAFMADGETFYKLHHGNVQNSVLMSPELNSVIKNRKGKFSSAGKLFCEREHSGVFSDGSHYYLQVPEGIYE